MFRRKDVPVDESLKRACFDNGLQYEKNSTDKSDDITLISDCGKEIIIDKNGVVKMENPEYNKNSD